MPLARRGPGLIGTAARTAVFAGTATAVSGRVQRRQQQRWAEQDAAAYEQQQAAYEQQAPAPAAPAAPAGEPDYMAELQQLAQLRDQGILTPEEFEAKKKQLLGI
jgi:Short C-terminal domain